MDEGKQMSVARELIAPQLSQTFAKVTKSSIATSTTQTDENITRIKCSPLKLLKPLSSVPQPNASPSIPSFSASSAQADLLTCTPPIAAIISESPPVKPIPNNDLSTPNSGVQSTSIQDAKQKQKHEQKKGKKSS
ncbi:uncharacterized protein TNCV_2028231 [Trichonephila clavipes]|nr:uncharacterized protein TNCV_2028231 [Trichonephila clavipes]